MSEKMVKFWRPEPVVMIIESPSDEDLYEGRTEGAALTESLKLFGYQRFKYKLCTSKESFRRALIELGNHPLHAKIVNGKSISFEPIIHISAHANEVGIGLTSGEIIEWAELIEYLNKYLCKGNYIPHLNRGIATLCLSTCHGHHVRKELDGDEKWPIMGIIAPIKEIPWSCALAGWSTYYHLSNRIYEVEFLEGTKPPNQIQIVESMNQSADPTQDYFKCINK